MNKETLVKMLPWRAMSAISRGRLAHATVLVMLAVTLLLGTSGATILADAGTRYVATAGSDAWPNRCLDPGAPCQTVGHALQMALEGQSVQVAEGIYVENLHIAKPVTLLGGYEATNWTRDLSQFETILDGSGSRTVVGDWDGGELSSPVVLDVDGRLEMWYQGRDLTGASQIGVAISTGGHTWAKQPGNPRFGGGPPDAWDEGDVGEPFVMYDDGVYRMWYTAHDSVIGYATSNDGITWSRHPEPVLEPDHRFWDGAGVSEPYVISVNGTLTMWYEGGSHEGAIGCATSPDGVEWTKCEGNPVLGPGEPGSWDSGAVGNPVVILDGGGYRLWYSGRGDDGRWSMGHATSTDGINWLRSPGNPVLSPTEEGWDRDGLDPGDVHFDGIEYRLWYRGGPEIGYASSPDGETWQKLAQNPVLTPGWAGEWGRPVVHFDGGSEGAVLGGFTIVEGQSEVGAGVLVNSDVTIANSTMARNHAHHGGGGIMVDGQASAHITGVIVKQNTADYGAGIGIREGSTVTIAESSVLHNSAHWSGGGVGIWGGAPVVEMSNSIIRGNDGFDSGGLGMWEPGGTFTGSNLLVVENTSGPGPCGLAIEGSGELANVTVARNRSELGNAGAEIHGQGGAYRINNSIFYNNSAFDRNLAGDNLDVRYSNVENPWGDVWPGEGNISSDPHFIDPDRGAYELAPGSQSINAGDPDSAFNDVDGTRNDIGAFGGPGGGPFGERPLTPLTLGVPEQGSVGPLAYVDYALDLQGGEQVLVELTAGTGTGQVWLLGRRGALPSAARYEVRVQTPTARGKYDVIVAPARAGTHYFTVYGWDIAGDVGQFTITARTVERYLSDVRPHAVGNVGSSSVVLQGVGLTDGMSVELRRPGLPPVATQDVVLLSSQQASALFDLTGAAPGSYDVTISWPDASTEILPGALEIQSGGVGSQLEATLRGPEFVRSNRTFVLWLEYANAGDADMVAPHLSVSSSSEVPMSLYSEGPFENRPLQVMGINQDGYAGLLSTGASGTIPIYFRVPPGTEGHEMLGFELSILVSDTLPIDWSSVQADMQPSFVSAEAWEVVWPILAGQLGDTWGEYRQRLAADAGYLSSLGRTVYGVQELFGFEVHKALGMNPRYVLAEQIDAAAPAPGLPLEFRRFFPASLEARFELGPFGRGWSHSYDMYLEEQDGEVLLHWPGASLRLFTEDEQGEYTATPGDYGVLGRAGAGYQLTEKEGVIFRFQADGKLDAIEDPNGNRINASYDGNGRLSRLDHTSGDAFLLGYDAWGHIAQLTDQVGRITVYGYDGTGEHLLTVTAPGARVTGYEYEAPAGQASDHALLSIAHPDGRHQYYTYDSLGRLSGEHLDDGAERLTYTYDAFHRIHVARSAAEVAIVSPDEHGRPAKVGDGLGREVGRSFNTDHSLSRVTDPSGQAYGFQYDGLGNSSVIDNPLGETVRMDYDLTFSQIAWTEDGRGIESRFEHDDAGNVTAVIYPDGLRESMSYDSAGNPIRFTGRNGATTAFTYSAQGQLLRKEYHDGSWAAYTYDAAGNLTSAANADGAITMEYDADSDWLTRVSYSSGHTLEYEYDDAGRRLQVKDQDGFEVNYAYDLAGRLVRLTQANGTEIVTYAYNDSGRPERETKGNGSYTTYAYDAAGQLTSLVNFAPDDSVQSRFDYTYDTTGNRTSMTTLAGTTTYEYDLIGQVTGVTFPTGRRLAGSYDAAGSRLQLTDSGAVTNYTTNTMSQYTQVGAATYGYDANGNRTSRSDQSGITTYTYDAQDQLVRVDTPTMGSWTYSYDALGNRVTAEHDGAMTRYVHDPGALVDVVAEYDDGGQLVARYVHGLGLAARLDAAGSAAYYAFDAIGSVVQMTGASGAVLNSYDYAPFGAPLAAQETISNPFRYVGRFGIMQEGYGLNFMRARFYDPQLGSFISPDPLPNPLVSPYVYAGNAPTTLIDPTGTTKASDALFKQIKNKTSGYDLPEGTKKGVASALKKVGSYAFLEFHTASGQSRDGKRRWKTVSVFAIKLTDKGALDGAPKLVGSWTAEDIEPDDPNEKIGPPGFGRGGNVYADDEFRYTIYFENKPEAGAPAQEVFVSDDLEPNLDWSTFRLVEVAWGDTIIAAPDGTADFYHRETIEDYRPDVAKSWWVDVEVDVDRLTGRVSVAFHTLDPQTEDLPYDVFAGFLPPNDETGRGDGHVSFAIRPLPGLEIGTHIGNRASIVFDTNEPIVTNDWWNTIGFQSYLPAVSR